MGDRRAAFVSFVLATSVLLAPSDARSIQSDDIGRTGDAAYRERYAGLERAPAPPLFPERWLGVDGELDLASLRGRVVLLDFWGVWCAPCVKSTRQLVRLHDLYASRGLTIVGVHTQSGKDGVDAYVRKKGVPYPVMVDADDATANAYRVTSFPTASLIDHEGRLRFVDIEVLEDGLFRGDVERAIRLLLDERDAALGPLATTGVDTRFRGDVLPRLAEAERAGFSGYVMVEQRGETLLDEGFGLADREAGRPWQRDTVTTVGSLTKQFTAAAILRLQEQERLTVEDSIAEHLPGVPDDKRAVTVHHLLTHTSGLAGPELDDWDPVERDDYVGRVLEAPLLSDPGARHAYSNAGYSLLGAIVEHVTGGSYEEYLREAVLAPAGLERTGYVLPDFEAEAMAVGYREDERWGTVLERPMAADGPYWALRANGGVHSTPAEMLRWARSLLDGRVLSPASLEALWTPWVREGADAETWYGYGWTLLDLPTGDRVALHNGSNGVFYAELAIEPRTRTILLVMTNAVSAFPDSRGIVGNLGDRLLIGPSPLGW